MAKATAITPKQALANTRVLLEAKQAHAQDGEAWQSLDPGHRAGQDAGFQSQEARAKAVDLHAAESRLQAIQGSASTKDRRNQGKRDHR